MNEDRVAPGEGFPPHRHRDMEILSMVLSGALQHRDSLGNSSVIRPGEIQRMTAGTGVTHSEANPSADEPVHFLQIWVLPEAAGLRPGYEQRRIEPADDGLRLIASRGGQDGAVTIHQDVAVYRGRLSAGAAVERALAKDRHAWVQLISGRASLHDQALGTGDGAAISGERSVRMSADGPCDFLLFDLS